MGIVIKGKTYISRSHAFESILKENKQLEQQLKETQEKLKIAVSALEELVNEQEESYLKGFAVIAQQALEKIGEKCTNS